jgi:DNA replication and repair protein RecF
MRIDRVCLENFRNYEKETVEFFPGINVITGENAQGKTNLLESVYMLSCGHSYRTRFDRELIFFGSDTARITADVFSSERQQKIDIQLAKGQKKHITCNGVSKKSSELSDIVRVVFFCPDDLSMIKEGSAERRRFLDLAVSQLRPAYAKLVSDYSRLYDHKRTILASWRDKPSLLDALDEYSEAMCRLSAQIIRYRAAFIRRLEEAAVPIHAECSGRDEQLGLAYETVSTVTDPFATAEEIYRCLCDHQKSHREAEIASESVLCGIHKDDLVISINGVNAKQFASQGQTRTAALSLKMAEREISFQDTGENPILLLDDVLSELDPRRQEFVLNRIGGGQTLITCCEDEKIMTRTGGKVITIAGGRLE